MLLVFLAHYELGIGRPQNRRRCDVKDQTLHLVGSGSLIWYTEVFLSADLVVQKSLYNSIGIT